MATKGGTFTGTLAIVLRSRIASGGQGARDGAQARGAETIAESTGFRRQRYRETIRFGVAPAVTDAAARTTKSLSAAFADHAGRVVQVVHSCRKCGKLVSNSSNRARWQPASSWHLDQIDRHRLAVLSFPARARPLDLASSGAKGMLAASHVGKEMTSVTNRVEGGHGPDLMLQAIGVTEVTGHLLAGVSPSGSLAP